MNETKFAIAWESKPTGHKGQGTKTFSLQKAASICDSANNEFPNIDHYPEKTNTAC